MKKIIISLFVFIFLIISVMGIKGKKGFPVYFQQNKNSQVGGPFESTGSTSRFSLVEAIVENGTVIFNDEQASASAPDISKYNDKVFTIFTPGVSFLAVPFYYLGKAIGLPQLVTFLSTLLVAFINVFLIIRISKKMGMGDYSAMLAGFTFLFATNAFTYAFTLTQHHLSTLIILWSINLALSERRFINNLIFSALFGYGIMVDIPNAFCLLPAGIVLLNKNIFLEKNNFLKIKTAIIGLFIGLIPMLMLFGFYNKLATGSYFLLGQTIGRSDYNTLELIQEEDEILAEKDIPLDSRIQLRGLYITLFSNQRGIIVYNTIILFGFIGIIMFYKNKNKNNYSILVISTVIVTILLYSMHGDPWGGWSFGSRYMIPVSALLAPAGVYFVSGFKGKYKYLVGTLFVIVMAYGIGVNSLSTLTTAQIPPKGEAEHLIQYVPYTYKYNFNLINQGFTGSLVYDLYLRDTLSVKLFTYLYFLTILIPGTILYFLSSTESEDNK